MTYKDAADIVHMVRLVTRRQLHRLVCAEKLVLSTQVRKEQTLTCLACIAAPPPEED